ncbi:MAG TPA: tRNA lysidine(34) synthetase TilS, partial [Clostridiales bacterium]|nr:tRNA lysidine(34) synthetase TilS [Clostridiales bacterium]
DAEYAAQICSDLGIPFHTGREDVPRLALERRISLETAAREARYFFLSRIAKRIGADRIAVAHTMNDQAETVLMHLARGTGPEGLAGMEMQREWLIRPLLGITRREVEAYCLSEGLFPRTDKTNLQDGATRNALRNQVIPLIEKVCRTDFVQAVGRLSGLLREESGFLQRLAEQEFAKCGRVIPGKDEVPERVVLSVRCLAGLDPVLGRRVMRIALSRFPGGLVDTGYVHILKAMDLTGPCVRNGKIAEFRHGLRAVRRYEEIHLESSAFEADLPQLHIEQVRLLPREALKEDDEAGTDSRYGPGSAFCAMFDMDALCRAGAADPKQYGKLEGLPAGLEFRCRRTGDRIRIKGTGGTRTLKKHFIDRKIPREIRDRLMLLALGDEILWIPGSGQAGTAKINPATRRVLRIDFRSDSQTLLETTDNQGEGWV